MSYEIATNDIPDNNILKYVISENVILNFKTNRSIDAQLNILDYYYINNSHDILF